MGTTKGQKRSRKAGRPKLTDGEHLTAYTTRLRLDQIARLQSLPNASAHIRALLDADRDAHKK